MLCAKRGKDMKDHKISALLRKWVRPGLSVLIYCPLKHEVDITPFIKWARQRKIRLFAPLMHPPCCTYAPYRLPLSTHQQTKQPRPSFLKTPLDLALVPILGMDCNFRRVGFGLGAYDRLFANLAKKPFTIFIARQILKSPHVLGEPHDITADACLEPSHYFTHKRTINGRSFKHFDPLPAYRHRRFLLH
ncbi:5-formyltetrahydrofolate cyclo-ligase [Helicobacter ailurogastricus]|uniref:5-formyltetrahydrofolate cyclo-ligase n=1 Tax=Helicobacter ailurogastricus TaxID=1578720 RepID=UPI002553D8EE|nr:5-formyltetrahydrofolate cyclo-ligase [Helicobacter ailurogastricus]